MHEVNLRSIDLNLLTILDALLEERNVTRAGIRLGMSQPAVSRALARLRAMFEDPLLVDGPGGYLPSARACDLQPVLRRTLAEIGGMLEPQTFEPAQAAGRVRLATPDLYAAVIVPPLLAIVAREAPGLNLDIVTPSMTILDRLVDDSVEAVLGVMEDAPAGVRRRQLFDDRYVTLLRTGHPAADGSLILEDFVNLEHIAITVTGDGVTPVDRVLAGMGRTRRVKVRVPNFLAAVEIAANSDLVMTLPESLARVAGGMHRFVRRVPPADPGQFTLSLLWHDRNQSSPFHRWLRDAVVRAAEEVKPKA